MRFLSIFLFYLSTMLAGDPARDARWQQDLDYLSTQLPRTHPNLFFKTPRADFNSAVSNLRAAIPNLTDVEVMAGMAAVVALPGDGHTNLQLTQINSSFRVLPMRLMWFQDGLFVTGIGNAYSHAVGARVREIGNQTVDQAYNTIATIISHENDPWVRELSPGYLVNADILQALNIAPDNASVHFGFEDLTGATFSFDIASLAPGQSARGVFAPDPATGFIALNQQHLDQNYWFTYLPGSRTLYFAYNRCAQMPGLPFAQFNDQLWAAFDANPVDRVVIDLRNNSGGDSSLINPAFASAAQRVPRLATVQRYAIIGRETFSSAIDDAVEMKQSNFGLTFIGEPTGGSVNHYGNITTLTLPNSKLNINCSTVYFSFSGFPEGSMIPDVNITLYSRDYFARHDPFLAAAMAGATFNFVPPGALNVVNSADLRMNVPVAPGTLATVFGDFSSAPPDSTTVQVNGESVNALSVSPAQINFQVPGDAAIGTATLQVMSNAVTLATGVFEIGDTDPGLFVADPFNLARPGVVLDQNSQLISAASPAQPGSVIQIYSTGQGTLSILPRVFLGSDAADVLSSAAHPSIPGIWLITARVPAVSGETPLFVVAGANASNGVTLRVGN